MNYSKTKSLVAVLCKIISGFTTVGKGMYKTTFGVIAGEGMYILCILLDNFNDALLPIREYLSCTLAWYDSSLDSLELPLLCVASKRKEHS